MGEDNDYSIFSSSRTNLFNYFHRSKADAIPPLTPLGIAQAEATRDYLKRKTRTL